MIRGYRTPFPDVNEISTSRDNLSPTDQRTPPRTIRSPSPWPACRGRSPDPAGRSISHGNLSNYLDRSGATDEAARHLLAAIVYDLVTNRRQGLAIKLKNLANRIRRADGEYELPGVAASSPWGDRGGKTHTPSAQPIGVLLGRPEFAALGEYLSSSGREVEEVQAGIDVLVGEVRRVVGG